MSPCSPAWAVGQPPFSRASVEEYACCIFEGAVGGRGGNLDLPFSKVWGRVEGNFEGEWVGRMGISDVRSGVGRNFGCVVVGLGEFRFSIFEGVVGGGGNFEGHGKG